MLEIMMQILDLNLDLKIIKQTKKQKKQNYKNVEFVLPHCLTCRLHMHTVQITDVHMVSAKGSGYSVGYPVIPCYPKIKKMGEITIA